MEVNVGTMEVNVGTMEVNVGTMEVNVGTMEVNVGTMEVNVGTRKSKLALVQTELVVGALTAAWPHHKFVTQARDAAAGDVDKVTPFKDMPAKNIWTHDLETLLIQGQLQVLVHSLKDVPTVLPPGCEISAVLERENPKDAFVIKAGKPHCKISDLPPGAVVGTSSIRRTAQIALKYPHLVVKDVRGNVDTRLAKLDADNGQFDALILAAAGLLRLNLGHRISQYLDSDNGGMLHAVGQGAIGIENADRHPHIRQLLTAINHTNTFLAITAERSLLRTIEGGCSAPLGVETTWVTHTDGNPALHFKAIVVSLDGKQSAAINLTQPVKSVKEADELGAQAANEILRKGADKILAEIKAKKPTTPADLA